MKTILIASQNPVKIQAVRRGFERMFPGQEFRLQTLSVPSGVSDQPASDAETLDGALGRTRHAARQAPLADYWVGVEGGVEERDGELAAFAWVVVRSPGKIGRARTGTFYLPRRVAELVRAGKELGEADDIVFNRSNSKQENGAIGLLTGDVVDRAALYEQAVIMALIPFKNGELYE